MFVTVVLPTRDREAVVGDAIGSVLAQTHADLELVVVDEATTPPRRSSSRSPTTGFVTSANGTSSREIRRALALDARPKAAVALALARTGSTRAFDAGMAATYAAERRLAADTAG